MIVKYETPGGWDVIHGREWTTHHHLDVGLATAIEAIRHSHFDGVVPMILTDWILDYHFARHMRYKTHSRRWISKPPGVWRLYPPGLPVRQDTRRSALPLHAMWIRFHGGDKVGLHRLVDNPTGLALFEDPTGWLTDRVRAIAIKGDSLGESDYTHVLSQFMDILHHLLNSPCIRPGVYRLKAPEVLPTLDPLVTRANEYLLAHHQEPLTLGQIAKALHVSISTLHRRYGAATGESIAQTLILFRVSKVKQLLSRGLSVAEAADCTGFYDQFHLSKTFRRIEGISPREFIKQLKATVTHQRPP